MLVGMSGFCHCFVGFPQSFLFIGHLGHSGEVLQPAALDRHPEADEAKLTEDAAKTLNLGSIPPAGNDGKELAHPLQSMVVT